MTAIPRRWRASRGRAVRAARRRRTSRTDAGGRRARRRRRGVPGRRCAGDRGMAYGTETIRPVDVIVGPGNMYVARRQARGRRDRGHRVAGRARRRWSSWPTTRRSRHGRGRPRRPGRARARRRRDPRDLGRSVADAVDARRQARRRRAAPRSKPPRVGRPCGAGRRVPSRRWRRRMRSLPSTSSSSRPTRSARPAGCATPARCSAGRGRRRSSATTWPVSTTCSRPAHGTIRERPARRHFRKHVHVVTLDQAALRRSPPHASVRRDGGPRRARAVGRLART